MNKEKIKKVLKKIIDFFLNPHLIICIVPAWFITNGWSYIGLALGTFFKINWLVAVSGAYMSFLWFPFTPEKIVTVVIAIWLLKLLFPKDEKTLAVLIEIKEKIKADCVKLKEKKKPSLEE